jgi:hypothetical protein
VERAESSSTTIVHICIVPKKEERVRNFYGWIRGVMKALNDF